MKVPNETSRDFLRVVRSILRIEDVGLRVEDQLCEVVRFNYVDSATPFDVAVDGGPPPLAVWCLDLSDNDTSDSTRHSGRSVQWTWRGNLLRIHDIDVPASANTYTATVGILR